jgi:hypothetical protein
MAVILILLGTCTASPFQKGAYPQTACPFFMKELERRNPTIADLGKNYGYNTIEVKLFCNNVANIGGLFIQLNFSKTFQYWQFSK